ncbi:uncharacterized protein LOC133522562 [Cydia pomonella]|uniref:uncharacterized protein LOC133522562 n=1 Tax=Cydia pomonella TaxID=82600 RepID=UPI002ADE50B3|nr:uncharacterized protein LOC133522562 [Cydia pomonella]
MFRLLSTICIFAMLQNGWASPRNLRSDEVTEECRNTYNNELSNDFLEGVWYEVAKYTFFGGLVPSIWCTNNTIYKATDERLAVFESAYGVKIPREENPVLINNSNYALNLLIGHLEAKDHFMQPGFALEETVWNYRRLTDDYMMVWSCALRGRTIWLHSRIRDVTNQEIAEVTTGVPELSRLEMQRYCAPY